MLSLTRRIGESLLVGEDVVLTVVGTNGNQVRLGVDAPIAVRILREEHLRKPVDACPPSVSRRERLSGE